MKNDKNYHSWPTTCCTILISILFIVSNQLAAAEKNLIFPIPQEITLLNNSTTIDENTRIIVPSNAGTNDTYLAKFLVREMSDTYGLALGIDYTQILPNAGKNYIKILNPKLIPCPK